MALSEINNPSSAQRRDFLKTTGKAVLATALAPFLPYGSQAAVERKSSSGASGDLEKISALLDKKEPNIWLFTGDSITHGVKHTHGERSYPEIFQERVRYEIRRYRDVVINTGISGHTTENLLQDFDWRVSHFRPSVVSFMLGTNDCARQKVLPETYYQNLRTLVSKIRSMDAVPVMHTPNTIISEKAPERQSLPDYITLIRQVALEDGVIVVDNYKHWYQTDEVTVHGKWLNDALHPNGTGHREIAHELFKSLGIFDPNDPTCGAPYYEGDH